MNLTQTINSSQPRNLLRSAHRFSVDDYKQMIQWGILTENHHVELIRGEVVDKMPTGEKHLACVNRLNRFLNRLVGDLAIVSIQSPVVFPDSEPEPGVTLLRPRPDFYESGKPQPADVLLLIEVSDSTLADDRAIKGSLYAEAGITDYWIVNLVDRCLEVYRQPRPDGTYGEGRTYQVGESVELLGLPGSTLSVATLF